VGRKRRQERARVFLGHSLIESVSQSVIAHHHMHVCCAWRAWWVGDGCMISRLARPSLLFVFCVRCVCAACSQPFLLPPSPPPRPLVLCCLAVSLLFDPWLLHSRSRYRPCTGLTLPVQSRWRQAGRTQQGANKMCLEEHCPPSPTAMRPTYRDGHR